MPNDRPRDRSHRILWIGYALIFSVVVLAALAVTSAVQTHALRDKTVDLYGRIGELKSAHKTAQTLLEEQASENRHQDERIAEQNERLRRQGQAITRLSRLRKQDATALTSLHNELAVRNTADAPVKQRLQQLEANNAAARNVINTAPAPPGKDGKP